MSGGKTAQLTGFVNWDDPRVLGKKTKVFLDGNEIKDVKHANADEGWLRRIKRRSNGQIAIDLNSGCIETEIMAGEVRVEVEDLEEPSQSHGFSPTAGSPGPERRDALVVWSTTPWPILGSLWVHLKTGRIYRVEARSLREYDLEPLVTYSQVHVDGIPFCWTRTLAEFMDGRFTMVVD